MPDHQSIAEDRDKAGPAAAEDYEVRYLARATGITLQEARDLIARLGRDRELLEPAARSLKKVH